MTLDDLKQQSLVVTGAKQVVKAIKRGEAQAVFIAADAAERITRPIVELCAEENIVVDQSATMEDLGKACRIAVGAAAAAVLAAKN